MKRQLTGETVRLVPPRDLHDPEHAIQAWLLSLWHLFPRHRHQFLRNTTSLSLEIVSNGESTWMQAWSEEAPLADVTRSVLGGAVCGLEVAVEAENDWLPEEAGDWSHVRLVWSGEHQLGAPGVDVLPGLLRAMANGPCVVQLLLDAGRTRSKDGPLPGFWLSGRLLAFGTGRRRTLAQMSAAMGQLAGINRLLVGKPRSFRAGDRHRVLARLALRRLLQPGTPATPAQIATLFHFPVDPSSAPELEAMGNLRLPIIGRRAKTGILLGSGLNRRGEKVDVRLPAENLARHALVVGPSGSGKSVFLAQVIRQLAEFGHGVTVIDPHGSLVAEIASTLSESAFVRAAIVQFADRCHIVGLNPLAAARGREAFVADELVELLGRVYGRAGWGPLLELSIRHAAIASAEVGGSLLDTADILQDPYYRNDISSGVRSPATSRFLERLGDAGGLDRRILPAVHRLDRVLSSPLLRASLSLREQTLRFEDVFSQRRILLLDLSGVGMAGTRVLGSILLLLIRNAALSRPVGAPLHAVVVDEAPLFLSPTIAELLDQARKYGVGLLLALQRLSQLEPDSLRGAVTANVASLVAFRSLAADEASAIRKLMPHPRLEAEDLLGLGRFEGYARLVDAGSVLPPVWIRAMEPAGGIGEASTRARELTARGQALYSRPAHAVEQLLRQRRHQFDEPEIIAVDEPHPADTP